MEQVVVLGVPDKDPVLVPREEFSLQILGDALGTPALAGYLDAFDLALDRAQGLGERHGAVKKEWRLIMHRTRDCWL